MSEEILVISSDEENDKDAVSSKRPKLEIINDVNKNETCSLGLKITQVKSLVEENSDCDIIEINSDEETNNDNVTKNGNKSEDLYDTDSTVDNLDVNTLSDQNEPTCSTSKENGNELSEPDVTIVDNSEQLFSELLNFIEVCIANVPEGKYKDIILSKVDVLKNIYKEADPGYIQSKCFKTLLETNLNDIKAKPSNTIIFFKNVYEELKTRKYNENLELSDKQEFYVSKLRATMKKLDKRIRKLEMKEVNFDDDNDSTYIMLDRYKKKFCDVYSKYCEYMKEDAHSCRITHRKLDFNASKYVHINRAIDRLYFKEKKFPVFHEVDKYIRKCVREKEIQISESDLVSEIIHVYKEMGELVQRRRKTELEDIHSYFLGTNIDPATEDTKLKSQLDEQKKEGDQKIDKIFDNYTRRQELGEDPKVSSDSDDSGEENKESNEDNDDEKQ